MAVVRMLRGGQFTLPAEVRKALKLAEGDYLDLEIGDGVLTLKPVAADNRQKAYRDLTEILGRVKYTGPQPEPGEDEVMEMVLEEIRATRGKHAKGRPR
jgi:AbrB family looped-hinge helix DNA binding protein